MTEIVIGEDRPDVPEGTYPATLIGLKTATSKKFEGEFRVWTFQLANGAEVEGTSSMYTNPKSKPGKWMSALLGRQPTAGESVSLIGRPCLVSVIMDNGYAKVDAVLPPMNGGVQQPVQMYEGMEANEPPELP